MQRYTILFITINALHVSGGFSTHHQELKTVHTASGICQVCLLLPLATPCSVRRTLHGTQHTRHNLKHMLPQHCTIY